MDRAFWQSVAEAEYALPPGHALTDLTEELLGYLGSTDAELRDDIALTTLATWIDAGRYSGAELRAIAARVARNLRQGLGEADSDAVFLRTFSALILGSVIDYDNAQPFLEPGEASEILDHALDYLAGERDLRGFVAGKGWAHSAAHAADLLTYLARSRHLGTGELRQILHAIADKITAPAEHSYIYKEDERLAITAMAALRRDLLDRAFVGEWVGRLAFRGAPPWHLAAATPGAASARHNAKNLLRSLYFQLCFAKHQPAIAGQLRADLAEALQELEQRFYQVG